MRAEEGVPLNVLFRNQLVGDFSVDMLVEDKLILELKSAKTLSSEQEAQLMNYLIATGMKVRLLVNFGITRLEWMRIVR